MVPSGRTADTVGTGRRDSERSGCLSGVSVILVAELFQAIQGVQEREMLHADDEGDDVAVPVTTEAAKPAGLRIHHQRRVVILMERATPAQGTARLFEWHVTAH